MSKRRLLLTAGGIGAAAALASAARQRRAGADLKARVALVMGGSRGLGFLLAAELRRQGCKVAIVARDQRELQWARQQLSDAEAEEVLSLVCNVADLKQVEAAVQEATAHWGHLDILVNVAGIIQVGPIWTLKPDDFKLALDNIFWGMVNSTLAVLPQMRRQGEGSIVNITSIGAKVSSPHLLPYSSAKFATLAFSEGLHAELAAEGIQVTTVVPGFMRTGSHIRAYFKGEQEREYVMFSLLANLPFVSMDAERAARRIVLAIKRGETELILGLPAQVAARFVGAFPGTTAQILGLINRFLPSRRDGRLESQVGLDVQERLHSRALETVTAMGLKAARRYGEYPRQALHDAQARENGKSRNSPG